jgi:hypothetical protein
MDINREKDVQLGTFTIWLGRRNQRHQFDADEMQAYELIVHADATVQSNEEAEHTCRIVRLGIEHGKRGLHAFRRSITEVLVSETAVLHKRYHSTVLRYTQHHVRTTLPGRILLCSAEEDGVGGDLNAGLAVCILATMFDSERRLRSDVGTSFNLTKEDVHRRLQWITSALPQCRPPSRRHMLRINDALLGAEYRKT